jgi:hypothetical protein
MALWLAAGTASAAPLLQEDRPPPDEPPGGETPLPEEDDPSVEPESFGFRPPGRGLDDQAGPPLFDWPPEMDRARVREFLEEYFPEQAEDLYMLERFNPRLFRQRMREIAPRIMRLMRELERDEELGLLGIEQERLELKIHRAVRSYFETSDEGKREEIRARIEGLIGEQFDVRQQRDERSARKLERRLERFKRRVAQRAERREELITRELEMRLQPPERPFRSRGQGSRRRPNGPPPGRGPR